jgi:type II secretory pathway component PulK
MRLKETGSLPKLYGRGRKAFVLLTVLVVIAFLALAAYRYNDLMRSEYLASHGAQRSAESRALAESGLNYSMAVLFAGQGQLAVNTSQSLEVDPANSSPLKGSFQIIQVEEESAKLNLNSLLDLDSSGDTLRQVLEKVQSTIPEMTDDVIAAIIDWMDEDDDLEEQGAETEYYMALDPPYRAKNAPVDSIEELLLVRGVTPALLNGSGTSPGLKSLFTVNTREVNFESDGTTIVRLNEGDLTTLESGLSTALGEPSVSQFIMAYRLYGNTKSSGSSGGSSSAGGGAASSPSSGGSSSTSSASGGSSSTSGGLGSSSSQKPSTGSSGPSSSSGGPFGGASSSGSSSISAGGTATIVSSGGAVTVTASAGATAPQSSSITVVDPAKLQTQIDQDKQPNFFRQLKKVTSIFDLASTDVTVSYQSGNQKVSGTLKSPLKDPSVASQYLPLLFSATSTASAPDSADKVELPAKLNVMAAPYEVLSLLPGLEDQDIQNILTNRPQPGDSTGDTLAWLLTKAQISASKLSRVEKYLTTRPKMVRVVSVGKLDGFGVTTVLEGMIDLSGPRPRLAGIRDLSDVYRSDDSGQSP